MPWHVSNYKLAFPSLADSTHMEERKKPIQMPTGLATQEDRSTAVVV